MMRRLPRFGETWPEGRAIADAAGASGLYAILRHGGRESDAWRQIPIRHGRTGTPEALSINYFLRVVVPSVRQGAAVLLDPAGVVRGSFSSPHGRSGGAAWCGGGAR
jgi:hypothetical protein